MTAMNRFDPIRDGHREDRAFSQSCDRAVVRDIQRPKRTEATVLHGL